MGQTSDEIITRAVACRSGQPWRGMDGRRGKASISDYLTMLVAEAAGQEFSKPEHRRTLLPKLEPGRTKGAIEFKHMNISAIMLERGLPYVRGHAPADNYQAELATEVERRLRQPALLDSIQPRSLALPDKQLQQTTPPATQPAERWGGTLTTASCRKRTVVVASRENSSSSLLSRGIWLALDIRN